MFAIRIDKEKTLYNWYGCYVLDEKKSIKDVKRVKERTVDNTIVLTVKKQGMLHDVVRTMTKTSKNGMEWTIRPELIVLMIIGGEVTLNIKDKREEKAAAEMLQGLKGISIKRRVNDSDVEDINWRSVIVKRDEVRRITMNRKIQLVIIEALSYRQRIPDYISRLMPWFEKYGCLHVINPVAGKIPMDNIYFVGLFKKRLVVTRKEDLASITNVENVVVTIITETTGERYKLEGVAIGMKVELDYVLGSRLHFTDGVTVMSYAPTTEFSDDIGRSFRAMFSKLQLLCTMDAQSVCHGGVSLLDRVVPAQKIMPSITSRVIYNKINHEIESLLEGKRQRVNIIMIGEKGSGKSMGSRLIAEAIKMRYGEDVDIISSDAYGRWLLYLCQKYGVTKPEDMSEKDQEYELSNITLEQYLKVDEEKGASWYEEYAAAILERRGIKTVNDYTKLSLRARQLMMVDVINVMTPRLRTKSPLSVSSYYARLEGAMQNRVCICECHITEESTQTFRSDVIFRLKPFVDPRWSVLNRERGVESMICAELLLYDTYESLIGDVNPSVYISDLVYRVLLPMSEKR